MLAELLWKIAIDAGNHQISVHVINDGSIADYKYAVKLLETLPFHFYSYYKTKRNYGKGGYWQLIDFIMKKAQSATYDFAVQLPDDVGLVADFFNKAIAAWNSIADRRKICLNLLNDYNRDGKSIWTNTRVKELGNVKETGWVDMCYIATRNFFEALNYKIVPVDHEWTSQENKSSGVGMQISKRLNSCRWKMFQVNKSLVIHGAHASVMHPSHRVDIPLITNHISEKITATMASMPSRMNACEDAVKSLLPQVNELWIYLNDFTFIPDFMNHSRIKLFQSQKHIGDLGDAGKFYQSHLIKGYHFTVDDDIIYPADYCQKMIAGIEQYKKKAVITTHGRKWKKMPVKSYYHNDAFVCQCTKNQDSDQMLHVPGTGVMAYHTDTMQFEIDQFKSSNMADIWAAVVLQSKGIPVVSISHKAGWIALSRKSDENYSIYSAQHRNDSYQTEIVNSVKWKLYEI